ncbi:MAG: hypothetical protein Sylvanvirus3_8 [Sylvanvirus sp.]|uniref:Uncharacterized protein n=1 Tax=Sylvanvirus sp. TaxID=2487774 RepID=A0A3G5AIY1_9VIRU|nr:MAG: hypothetical protein Sylvanvirus3_8 [Sylvanvirus sp.]
MSRYANPLNAEDEQSEYQQFLEFKNSQRGSTSKSSKQPSFQNQNRETPLNKQASTKRQSNEQWHTEWTHLNQSHEPQYDWADPQDLDVSTWSQAKRGSPGSSNWKKYGPEKAPFCGPAGGAMLNTYPVYDPLHASLALGRSRNAPNEAGLSQCVQQVQQEKGWQGKRMPAYVYHRGPEAVGPYQSVESERRQRLGPVIPRGPMASTARTHQTRKYPGLGSKYAPPAKNQY